MRIDYESRASEKELHHVRYVPLSADYMFTIVTAQCEKRPSFTKGWLGKSHVFLKSIWQHNFHLASECWFCF